MRRLLLACLLLCWLTGAQASAMFWRGVRVDPAAFAAGAKDPVKVTRLIFDADRERIFDLDRDWQGLHYLLNGTAWEPRNVAGQAVLGGELIYKVLEGGRVYYFNPESVRAIADAMQLLSPTELGANYDPDAMHAVPIYPDDWAKNVPEQRQRLIGEFLHLMAFYRTAAEHGEGILVHL